MDDAIAGGCAVLMMLAFAACALIPIALLLYIIKLLIGG